MNTLTVILCWFTCNNMSISYFWICLTVCLTCTDLEPVPSSVSVPVLGHREDLQLWLIIFTLFSCLAAVSSSRLWLVLSQGNVSCSLRSISVSSSMVLTTFSPLLVWELQKKSSFVLCLLQTLPKTVLLNQGQLCCLQLVSPVSFCTAAVSLSLSCFFFMTCPVTSFSLIQIFVLWCIWLWSWWSLPKITDEQNDHRLCWCPFFHWQERRSHYILWCWSSDLD